MRFFVPCSLFLFAFSYAYFGKENEGAAVFGWALHLQSPRTAAVEGASSAFPSQDYGAALMNPALLQGEKYGAGIAWQSGDLADRQGIAVFSHPLSIGDVKGRMQHTYGVIDNGEILNTDEYGNETGLASYPLAQYYAITFAFPFRLFKFGVTGRYLWERLSETEGAQTGMALGMDWGFLWGSGRYGFGFMARHLGSQIRPFVKGGVNGYSLVSELAASLFWRSSPKFTWLFECAAPRYSPALGKLGLEFRFSEPVFLRVGAQREFLEVFRIVRSVFDKDEEMPNANYYRLFSAGAGYKFKSFALDYSYSMLIEGAGNEHRIGLSGSF